MTAEFMGQPKNLIEGFAGESGFNAMGRPVPAYRRQAGYDTARQMGCTADEAFACVNGMCEGLERDEPYNAMEAGMRYVDLTGTYRLMSVLLTAEKPRVRVAAR